MAPVPDDSLTPAEPQEAAAVAGGDAAGAASEGAAHPPTARRDVAGLTLRAAAWGSGLVVAWIVLCCFWVHFYNGAQQQFIILMGFGAMLTLFGLKKLMGLLPAWARLNRHELAIVYTMLLVSIPLCIIYRGVTESGIRQLHPDFTTQKCYPWVPEHYSTQDPEAVDVYNYGRGNRTWREVLPLMATWVKPSLYWGVTVLAFELAALGLLLIFRRKWIDEDRLQFPFATIPIQISNAPYPGETPAGGEAGASRRRQVIGFAMGLVICAPGLANAIVPELGSPVGVPPDIAGFGVDLTSLGIIPGVQLNVVLEPFALFMLMLLPLDVLVSAVITFVGLRLMMPKALLAIGMPAYADRIYYVVMYTMIRAGFIAGIPVWSIYFAREYLLTVARKVGLLGTRDGTFAKSLWRMPMLLAPFIAFYGIYFLISGPDWGTPSLRAHLYLAVVAIFWYGALWKSLGPPWRWPRAIDEWWNEQMVLRRTDPPDQIAEYRKAGALFGLATVIFMGLISIGQSAALLFLAVTMIFLANFTYARTRAQGAWGIFPPWHQMKLNAHIQNALGLYGNAAGWTNFVHTAAFGVDARCLGPHTHFMETMKLADETRTKRGDILKAAGIATALVMVFTMPIFLAFAHSYGVDSTSSVGDGWAHFSMWTYFAKGFGTAEATNSFSDVNVPLYVALGIGIVGGMMYLRREYLWFPLSPVGCFLGATIGGISHMGVDRIWFTVLVVFLVKGIIFSWYGVRTFQKKVLPVVINALMGLTLGMLILLIIWAFRGQGAWVAG